MAVTFTAERMVRWKLHAVLEERGLTAYKLAQMTGLTVPGVYRLAQPGAHLGRVEGRTLDLLCAALKCQPGDLLEHIHGKQRGERRRRTRQPERRKDN